VGGTDKFRDFDASLSLLRGVIKHGPRDRHKILVGARKQDLRFRRFSSVVALVAAEYQQIRALRDREAMSEGGTNKFCDFDASHLSSMRWNRNHNAHRMIQPGPPQSLRSRKDFFGYFLSRKESTTPGGAENK